MENIETAIKLLVDTKEELSELLGDENHLLMVNFISNFDRMIGRLDFISSRSSMTPLGQVDFPPITNFMGEELNVTKKVDVEELEPDDSDRAKFAQKVSDLQKNLPAISNEKILESYVVKEDQLVIRGVAKRAGLPNYKEAEINGTFLDEIRQGLIDMGAQQAFTEKQNENIDK